MDKLQELSQQYELKAQQVYQLEADKPDYNWSTDELKGYQDGQKELERIYDEMSPLLDAKAQSEKSRQRLETMGKAKDAHGPPDGSESEGGEKAKGGAIGGKAFTAEELMDMATGRKSMIQVWAGYKSIGEAFVESESYKQFRENPRAVNQKAWVTQKAAGFKATFDTAGSTMTGYDRQPPMVMVGTEMPHVADLLAQGTTTNNTIRYVKEDTFTNAATTVAEGAAKPEASFDTSEVDAPVRKIAVTAKVTDELFADFPAMQSYIDQRLRFMVAILEDAQLLTGNGTPPNLTGIQTTAGILTQATGTDPVPDAVYKAMVKIMTQGFFQPDGIVMNPLDWQDIRLLRTADGVYILGNPTDSGPQRLWGLPVVLTTTETQNTALVGAFKLGAQVFYREGIRVEATNSNEDDFEKNLITIRAEQREALAVYRPKAFCTVTGV